VSLRRDGLTGISLQASPGFDAATGGLSRSGGGEAVPFGGDNGADAFD
jgi:hypothetical protein